MAVDALVLASEAAGPMDATAGRFLPLVLAGVLSLRVRSQLRQVRRGHDDHAAAVRRADERARALARKVGSGGAQRGEASAEDVGQG